MRVALDLFARNGYSGTTIAQIAEAAEVSPRTVSTYFPAKEDIVFDINEALSFDGRTGPYIQNAHVRANSILKKSKVESQKSGDLGPLTFDYELTKHEIELIEQISQFPAKVQQAANEYRPLVMAQFAYDLANAFHSFYHAVPVLQTEDEKIKNARLSLVAAAKQTIANALRLLDVQAPDVM